MRTPHYHEGRPRCLSPLSFLPWFLLLLPGGRLRFLPQKVGGGKKKKKKKTPMLRARMGLSMYCMLRMVGHSFTTKCTYNIARAKKKKKPHLSKKDRPSRRIYYTRGSKRFLLVWVAEVFHSPTYTLGGGKRYQERVYTTRMPAATLHT